MSPNRKQNTLLLHIPLLGQTPQVVSPRGSGGQVPGSLPCCPNMHMAHSQELEAASIGRPRHTWLRTVEADLRPFNLGLASGFKKAQDRTTWRALTGTAIRHRQAPNDDDDPTIYFARDDCLL